MNASYYEETKVVHAAFFDALSGEFIARTGCGVYVYMDPVDIQQMFKDYLKHSLPVREYVKRCVKVFFSG
ncbi:MAG: hypothetical protein PHH11_18200 [Methylomonas sp.]|nr:hypothetical protein [Methylomonas sp.]